MPRSTDFIGATGIGVSDLEGSSKFYPAALGMRVMHTINLSCTDQIIMVELLQAPEPRPVA